MGFTGREELIPETPDKVKRTRKHRFLSLLFTYELQAGRTEISLVEDGSRIVMAGWAPVR